MKVVAGIFGGLILSLLAMSVATIVFAAGAAEHRGTPPGIWVLLVTWVVAFIVALKATTAGKAWRRLMLSSAILSFLLPISGLVFTGAMMTTTALAGSGAAAAGAALGGGLISGALGFIGFFLGIVFLVVGLLVGRDKQVMYVKLVDRHPVPQPGMASLPSSPVQSQRVRPAKRVAPVEAAEVTPAASHGDAQDINLQAALKALRHVKAPV